jgi:hypothetical protein
VRICSSDRSWDRYYRAGLVCCSRTTCTPLGLEAPGWRTSVWGSDEGDRLGIDPPGLLFPCSGGHRRLVMLDAIRRIYDYSISPGVLPLWSATENRSSVAGTLLCWNRITFWSRTTVVRISLSDRVWHRSTPCQSVSLLWRSSTSR